MTKTTWVALLSSISLMAGCLTEDSMDAGDGTSIAARGGGGDGGGGGGGGAGGGTSTTVGAIRSVSVPVTCDDGTGLTVSLSKGNQDRVEMQVLVTNPVASPPTGYLELALVDAATGVRVNGVGSWPSSLSSRSITNLGGTVTVGFHTLDFKAIVHEGALVTGVPLVSCTTSIVVEAR